MIKKEEITIRLWITKMIIASGTVEYYDHSDEEDEVKILNYSNIMFKFNFNGTNAHLERVFSGKELAISNPIYNNFFGNRKELEKFRKKQILIIWRYKNKGKLTGKTKQEKISSKATKKDVEIAEFLEEASSIILKNWRDK